MIYLDYAAATPMNPKVIEAMTPFFAEQFFNPSAAYLPAKRVRETYESAKDDIAHTIGAKGNDLVITSGATEANNLAFSAVQDSEVLVLETEHASVLNLAKNFHYQTVKVDKNGRIDLADFRKKLSEKVGFVSISLANNELGTIQPIAEIAEIIANERRERLAEGNTRKIIFHTDASQALNLININVARLGVDLLTINSAKIYGPKGVGALYVKTGTRLTSLINGGHQERGLRAGTENVPYIVGLATALKEHKEHMDEHIATEIALHDYLLEQLMKEFPYVKINGMSDATRKNPGVLNFSIGFADAASVVEWMNLHDICISSGSACNTGSPKPSHVLMAMYNDEKRAFSSIRVSLSYRNTREEIDAFIKALKAFERIYKQ